jgi:acetyl-CoA C-acetyltransferase
MHEVYIVSAIRTPIGRFGGVLASLSPVDLGAYAMQAALTQAGLSGDALDLQDLRNCHRRAHPQHEGWEGAYIRTEELCT